MKMTVLKPCAFKLRATSRDPLVVSPTQAERAGAAHATVGRIDASLRNESMIGAHNASPSLRAIASQLVVST